MGGLLARKGVRGKNVGPLEGRAEHSLEEAVPEMAGMGTVPSTAS